MINSMSSKLLRIVACLGLVFALTAGTVACGGDTSDSTANQQQDDNRDDNHDDNQDNRDDNQDNRDDNQHDPEKSMAEAHQICAAAGQAEDGSVSVLHCSAPKGASGGKSTSGSLEWQPGAFHVVAE